METGIIPMEIGRPKKEWSDFELRTISKLSGLGLTTDQIGDFFGLTGSTIRSHTQRNERFRDAINQGRAVGLSKVAESLFKNATKHNNVSAQIFFLKTKGGYRESKFREIDESLLALKMHGVLPESWEQKTDLVVTHLQQSITEALDKKVPLEKLIESLRSSLEGLRNNDNLDKA